VKVLSLLPSATEIPCALGAEDSLCGVSSDCDYPEGVDTKPAVSTSSLGIQRGSSPAEIDAIVREHLASSDSIYTLDKALIQHLRPDLILAQDLCRVCAVPSGEVEQALDVIGSSAGVLSLDPHTLTDMLEDVLRVGVAIGQRVRAEALVSRLSARLDDVRRATQGRNVRRVVSVEWQDPLFIGGHWVPEMIDVAGGIDLLGEPGKPSFTVEWTEVTAVSPDVILFVPCGYHLAEAIEQLPRLLEVRALREMPAVQNGDLYVADSSAFFSRSGPRLVEGTEILAGILHPQVVRPPDPSEARRVLLDERGVTTTRVG